MDAVNHYLSEKVTFLSNNKKASEYMFVRLSERYASQVGACTLKNNLRGKKNGRWGRQPSASPRAVLL